MKPLPYYNPSQKKWLEKHHTSQAISFYWPLKANLSTPQLFPNLQYLEICRALLAEHSLDCFAGVRIWEYKFLRIGPPLCPFSVLCHFLGSLRLSVPFPITPREQHHSELLLLSSRPMLDHKTPLQHTQWLSIHPHLPQFWGYSFTCDSKASKHRGFDKISTCSSFWESRRTSHIKIHIYICTSIHIYARICVHTHTCTHTKILKIHIHLPFLNFFLGSGLMCQFSLRYVLLSSQQFFPNSSHSCFEMCFSLFPSKSLACPWQAAQLISFLIPFQLNSLIPSLKHPLKWFL